jgi:hypothetical protein
MALPVLPWIVSVGEGSEVSLGYVNQPGRSVSSRYRHIRRRRRHATTGSANRRTPGFYGSATDGFGIEQNSYVEEREKDETEEDGMPVMLNCLDWPRMPTPVMFVWSKLIWKPWPVGQPEVVATPCFKSMLTFGYTTWREQINGVAQKVRMKRECECG